LIVLIEELAFLTEKLVIKHPLTLSRLEKPTICNQINAVSSLFLLNFSVHIKYAQLLFLNVPSMKIAQADVIDFESLGQLVFRNGGAGRLLFQASLFLIASNDRHFCLLQIRGPFRVRLFFE